MVSPKVGIDNEVCAGRIVWVWAVYGAAMLWLSNARASAGASETQIWVVAAAIGLFLAVKGL